MLKGKIPVGSQMDTMNDPNSYANNSGLCGMQIQVPCPEDLSPTEPPEVVSKETWFSWEGAGIGYAVGLLVAVGVLYLTEYLSLLNLYITSVNREGIKSLTIQVMHAVYGSSKQC